MHACHAHWYCTASHHTDDFMNMTCWHDDTHKKNSVFKYYICMHPRQEVVKNGMLCSAFVQISMSFVRTPIFPCCCLSK